MPESSRAMEKLEALIDRLLGPGGCPWDRKQTPQTLRAYLIEEAHEAAEAVGRGDSEAVAEELGDLLFQIVFIVRLYQAEGAFGLEEVVSRVEAKMIRRHPHVFGDKRLETPEEVKSAWQRLKQAENGTPQSVLAGVPSSLPALMRAHRLSDRAAQAGLDWESPAAVLEKVEEETAELKEALAAGDKAASAGELGDLFFALANLARHLGLKAEEVVQAANDKFQARFTALEQVFQERGQDMAKQSPKILDEVWVEVKKKI